MADATIASCDAKYAFSLWRPITAIRNGDIDGNDATDRDASWEPQLETPLLPEYPCAHCITSGTARAILEAEFGTGRTLLEMAKPKAPSVVRKWNSIAEYAESFRPQDLRRCPLPKFDRRWQSYGPQNW
jgi:hypothetical protein